MTIFGVSVFGVIGVLAIGFVAIPAWRLALRWAFREWKLWLGGMN